MKRLTLDKETLRMLDADLTATVVGAGIWPPITEDAFCVPTISFCGGSGGGGMTSMTKPCPM